MASAPPVPYGRQRLYYCSKHTLAVLDTTTEDLDWAYDAGGTITGAPTVANGTVYVGATNGRVYAVDAADSTRQWGYTTGAREVSTSSSVADGAVYMMVAGDGATHAQRD